MSMQTHNAFNFLGDNIKVQNSLTANGLFRKINVPEQIRMTSDNIL